MAEVSILAVDFCTPAMAFNRTIISVDGRKMKQNLEQDKAYLLDKMSKMTGDFSIYGLSLIHI